MCKALYVGETGYYKFRRNLGKLSKDSVLSAILQEILDESPYNDNYGVPRIKELCIDTLINTIKCYNIHAGVLHSDRGSQYTGEEFRTVLSKAGVN